MEEFYCLGIDLFDETAVISSYLPGMKEPETISTITGSEMFTVPFLLAKKKQKS